MTEPPPDGIIAHHFGLVEPLGPPLCKSFLYDPKCLNPNCSFGHHKSYSEVPLCPYAEKSKCKFGSKCLRRHLVHFEDFTINGTATSAPTPNPSWEQPPEENGEVELGDAIISSLPAISVQRPPLTLHCSNSFDGLEAIDEVSTTFSQRNIQDSASDRFSPPQLSKRQLKKKRNKEQRARKAAIRRQMAADTAAILIEQGMNEAMEHVVNEAMEHANERN